MAKALPYTLTNQSVTVIFEGKSHVVQKGSPNYKALRKAVLDKDWASVPNNLTVAKSIKDWAKGKFTMKDNCFMYEGEQIPSDINTRVIKMATNGEDPTPLFKFWERLKKNPSMRSVLQLWPFLAHKGIPLTKDGTFLAYKGVKSDYKDVHSGLWDNSPGAVNKMPRNQISDDPNHACHEGFHVGALEYAGTFGPRVVVCEVDPEHVVCVPYDSSQHKMRVCEYKVIGNHNGDHLPSTVYLDDRKRIGKNDDEEIRAEEEEEREEEAAEEAADEVEEGYDPANDFLAEECEECMEKIPPDYLAEDNKYHAESCVHYDGTHPSKEQEEKEAAEEKKAAKNEKPTKKAAPKKEKKGIEKKKERKALKKAGKALVKNFDRLNSLQTQKLMDETIDTLREYAGKGLKIVGASKVPGGKTGLIAVILKTRKKEKAEE